ncbi:hypothetical protein [Cupriavidus plantarum]|uniref:Uncharacterized protein n=1 Tax=Cupriavidus plantarum TaxID=942865 RepID=A0A316EP49_9BURK|nr:hypothetical protein [Cupriavidus plantarum]PWK33501.1 hypothetical protein C7419_104176 [Cupriavidus plantarum]
MSGPLTEIAEELREVFAVMLDRIEALEREVDQLKGIETKRALLPRIRARGVPGAMVDSQ